MDSSDLSEPVGLVLSGGGAKGAFQAGVWQALCETGITSRVVRCNSRQVEPFESLQAPGRKIVEIYPRTTLPGILDDLNMLDNPAVTTLSGDLSFTPDYARRYFSAGYADGLAALRPSILAAELKW